jgi:hypothetical protein
MYVRQSNVIFHPLFVIPSQDGTHPTTAALAGKWVPASAGMTMEGGESLGYANFTFEQVLRVR